MSRNQIKTIELEKLLKQFQKTLVGHHAMIGKPIGAGNYELRVDDTSILDGTKREIYMFLKSYMRVYNLGLRKLWTEQNDKTIRF